VPLVEEGWTSGRVVEEVARAYLKPLKDSHIDTLILGCTHYPLLKDVIRKVMGPEVVLIDSAKQVAIEVKKILASECLIGKPRRGRHRFFVSDNPQWFTGLASRFLGRRIDDARRVGNV